MVLLLWSGWVSYDREAAGTETIRCFRDDGGLPPHPKTHRLSYPIL